MVVGDVAIEDHLVLVNGTAGGTEALPVIARGATLALLAGLGVLLQVLLEEDPWTGCATPELTIRVFQLVMLFGLTRDK